MARPRQAPPPSDPQQTLPPGQVADQVAVAAGAAATGAAVAPAAAGAVTAAAVTAATAKIVTGLLGFFSNQKKSDVLFLRQMIQQDYPQRTSSEIDELVKSEVSRQVEFERRMRDRLERDLPKALSITDPEKRQERLDAIIARERQYLAMREQAMAQRSAAHAEHMDVRAASPEGAYWKLDPTVKQHTLDCLLMGEKFWPWEVLNHFHPLLHTGCRCHLYTKQEATDRGWITPNHVTDTSAAVKQARAIMKRAGHIEETAHPGEIEAFIEERLDEAAKGPRSEQACHYSRDGCKNRATKSLIWAEGRAYIPVCDEHEPTARDRVKEQNDEVSRTVLIEADYEEIQHPRGRGGEWIRKGIRAELRKLTPQLKSPGEPEHRAPLQERGTEQGRYVWMRGKYVFVPRHRDFTRKIDHVTFHSPAGGTNIYRNGYLVQVEGAPPPPHHQDLNPPAQPDVRNIPGTAEYSPSGGVIATKSGGEEDHPQVTLSAMAQREKNRAEVYRRVERSLATQTEDVQPVRVGDHMAAVQDALATHGFVSVATWRDPSSVTESYKHFHSGAQTTFTWKRGFKPTVTDVHDWQPGQRGWDAPQEPLGRAPRTWEEFADEVRGVAYRLAHDNGQEANVGEVRLARPMELQVLPGGQKSGYDDHSGTHSYNGEIVLGPEVADVLKPGRGYQQGEMPTWYAGDNIASARSIWAGYKVATHEAIHGSGNGITGAEYAKPHLRGIEEALTEELAHVEAVNLMRTDKVTDALGWLRANPQDYKAAGTYPVYRRALDHVLNSAAIAPELREDYMRHLRWDVAPADRDKALAAAIKSGPNAEQFIDPLGYVRGEFAHGTGMGFQPILRPDLRDFPSADGVIWEGKRIAPGSTVTISTGYRDEKRDAKGRLRGSWKKKNVDVMVLSIGSAGHAGESFKMDVRPLNAGDLPLTGNRVMHNVVGSQVVAVPDEQGRQPGELPSVVISKAKGLTQPEERVTVGDTISYDGRSDGGRSEAVVTAVQDLSASRVIGAQRFVIEAVTTENSLKPNTLVLLTDERMNGLRVESTQRVGSNVVQLPERAVGPQPIAVAASVPELPPPEPTVKVRVPGGIMSELMMLEADSADGRVPLQGQLADHLDRAWPQTENGKKPATLELPVSVAHYFTTEALPNAEDIWEDKTDVENGGGGAYSADHRRKLRGYLRSSQTLRSKLAAQLPDMTGNVSGIKGGGDESIPNDQRVYIAEGAMKRGGLDGGEMISRHGHIDSPEQQAENDRLSKEAQQISGDPTLRVVVSNWIAGPGGQDGHASYDRMGHRISIRPVSDKMTFLHEIAHGMTRTPHNEQDSHGADFKENLAKLYGRHISPEAEQVFRNLAMWDGTKGGYDYSIHSPLDEYTKGGMQGPSFRLLTGNVKASERHREPEHRAFIERFDQQFREAKPTTNTMTVYRGQSFAPEPDVNGIVRMPQYVSTTTSPSSTYLRRPARLSIRIPAGSKVLRANEFNEKEVVLPRDAVFRHEGHNRLTYLGSGEEGESRARGSGPLSIVPADKPSYDPETGVKADPGERLAYASTTPRVYVHPSPEMTGVGFDQDPGRYQDWRNDVQLRTGVMPRGTPIQPDDPRIPDTVYHTTTNLPAVLADGYLRARGEGGLGGDRRDRIVSMTTDPKVAARLASDLHLLGSMGKEFGAAPDTTWDDQTRKWDYGLRPSWGARVRRRLGEEATRQGFSFGQSKPDATPEQQQLDDKFWGGMTNGSDLGDWMNQWFAARQSQTGVQNPAIFDTQNVATGIDPEKVGVVSIPRENLDNGALLTDFDLGKPVGLSEIRSYGDVPVGASALMSGGDSSVWHTPIPDDPPNWKQVGLGVLDSEDGRLTMYRIEGVRPVAWNVEWSIDYGNAVAALPHLNNSELYANIVDGAASRKDAEALFKRDWPHVRATIMSFEGVHPMLEALGVPAEDHADVAMQLLVLSPEERERFIEEWLTEAERELSEFV